MISTALMGPIFAMMGLTIVVWLWMYVKRISAIKAMNLDPEKLNVPENISLLPRKVSYPADNFKNLFEVPVFFYALCLTLQMAGMVDETSVTLAWVFVGLRALHSIIQCSYNRVMHRFTVYVLSSLTLFAMYGRALLEYMA